MSHVPHEIAEEFPEFKDKIHELKTSDGHFSRRFDEYHDINREIHRAASGLTRREQEIAALVVSSFNGCVH